MAKFNYHERLTSITLLILVVFILILHIPTHAAVVATPEEEERRLLEKSLSIVEIDKEIARIEVEQQDLMSTMNETDRELIVQEKQIEEKRDQAGEVLRAYYMGEREMMYTALFHSKSLSQFLQIVEFIELIMSKDKNKLDSYISQYRELQTTYTEMTSKHEQLAALENSLKMQRLRVLTLEQQIESELDQRTDSDRIRLLIEQLTKDWETEGVREVSQYFKALSAAMAELPNWLQDNKELMDVNGFNYTIRLPEHKLNAFLMEQDERFEDFNFQFEENQIHVKGNRDDRELHIIGHYTVEDTPRNGLIFHIDELIYNGFSLPDTTRSALEQEFDLGFYPGLILKFVKAKEVAMNDGELVISLSFSL